MDREDKRRYFIVGSVILEVVQPLFRQRLEKQYSSQGIGSLQAFLNQQPVIHILFHLRHRNVWCCTDYSNCTNNQTLPLIYCQWSRLYSENPGPGRHHCHCKYTANAVQLDDLDITLAGLILINCCNLGADENAVKALRQYKNDYLSHNTKGSITLAEYNTLWPDLKTYVLQLDPSKEDDLVRIKKRPLDEALCYKYFTCLLDIHKKLEEIDNCVQGLSSSVQTMDTNIQANHTNIQGTLQEVLHYVRRDATCQHCGRNPTRQGYPSQPYTLGQDIFRPYHKFNLKSVLNVDEIGYISGGVMMDDGRLVICLSVLRRLLICRTDGSEADSIQVQDTLYAHDVTAVNNSTVAVTLRDSECIEMYDINTRHKLKSIPVPGECLGITTINKKLLVGCNDRRLLMIDHQTGEVIQTIHTDCRPWKLHAAGDRIFYCDPYHNSTVYCYRYTDDIVTTTLPFKPHSITSIQDGSLYLVGWQGSVQHVSSDGQHNKRVKTKELKLLWCDSVISYNPNQQQLMTCNGSTGIIQVFKMK